MQKKFSVAGTILEWTFFQFIKTGLIKLNKDKIAVVENGFQIPFIWKEKGNKKLNIDIVIKSKKSTKLFYAFELKTNFEDGFSKYRKEERMLYHQRRKTFPYFKYYYISLNKITQKFLKIHQRDINTLIRRKELYIINHEKNNEETSITSFLKNIVNDLKNIE